jgi:hypothetical protein
MIVTCEFTATSPTLRSLLAVSSSLVGGAARCLVDARVRVRAARHVPCIAPVRAWVSGRLRRAARLCFVEGGRVEHPLFLTCTSYIREARGVCFSAPELDLDTGRAPSAEPGRCENAHPAAVCSCVARGGARRFQGEGGHLKY